MPSKTPMVSEELAEYRRSDEHRQKSKRKNTNPVKLAQQLAINPNLTHKQLAKINNVSQQAVSAMLSRYGITAEYVETFKQQRADIFAGVQAMVVDSLSPDDIKAAPVNTRAMLLGVCYDKERLERGQSTSNHAHDIRALVALIPDSE